MVFKLICVNLDLYSETIQKEAIEQCSMFLKGL